MVLIILLIPIGLWTASFLLDQPVLVTDITVEGRYYNLYDNNGYIEFYEEKRQYYHGSYIRKKENESMYSIEDTYRVKGNKVILSNLIIRKDIEYLVYNNYLIQRDLAFKNTIPKGKTFNVSCIRNNIKYVFNKDGSFSKVKVNNDRETTELSGTYQRDEEIITLKVEGEDKEFKLLIYENKLHEGSYKKEES